MPTKLTLELDETLVERAEQVARASGRSISDLVADYLMGLAQPSTFDEKALPPLTRALSGVLEGADVNEFEYYQYLARKHA